MDFPDEVDTPFKDARKRFQKYRGIKSLKTCDWDPYENLPAEYSRIFRFQNFEAEVK
jgi:pre-rRNA-processing protein TSR1